MRYKAAIGAPLLEESTNSDKCQDAAKGCISEQYARGFAFVLACPEVERPHHVEP